MYVRKTTSKVFMFLVNVTAYLYRGMLPITMDTDTKRYVAYIIKKFKTIRIKPETIRIMIESKPFRKRLS